MGALPSAALPGREERGTQNLTEGSGTTPVLRASFWLGCEQNSLSSTFRALEGTRVEWCWTQMAAALPSTLGMHQGVHPKGLLCSQALYVSIMFIAQKHLCLHNKLFGYAALHINYHAVRLQIKIIGF